MTKQLKTSRSGGFAMWELLVVLVVVVVIAAVGYFVWNRRHDTTTSPVASQTVTPSAPAGTTESVEQGISQGEQAEDSAYGGYSTSAQQNATSDSGALNNLAGAYNENNL